MFERRAMFISLDACIRRAPQGQEGWAYDPLLPGALRDVAAMGFALVGIFEPTRFGLGASDDMGGHTDSLERSLRLAGAPDFDAIVTSSDVTNPQPIWGLQARLGIALRRSVLVGRGTRYEALAANAGFGQLAPPEAALGATWLSAAA